MTSQQFQLEIDFNWTLEILYAPHTLGACLSLCEVSQKSMKGISRYLRTSKKGINYELKTGLFADDLLLFRCFRKGFIAH